MQSPTEGRMNARAFWTRASLDPSSPFLHTTDLHLQPRTEKLIFTTVLLMFPKALTRGKADVYTNMRSVQSEVRRTGNKGREAAESKCGATAVVAPHKVSFNQHPTLLLRSPRKKTSATAGILLAGASGKHHKTIKSKATLCSQYTSLRSWNRSPLRCGAKSWDGTGMVYRVGLRSCSSSIDLLRRSVLAAAE